MDPIRPTSDKLQRNSDTRVRPWFTKTALYTDVNKISIDTNIKTALNKTSL